MQTMLIQAETLIIPATPITQVTAPAIPTPEMLIIPIMLTTIPPVQAAIQTVQGVMTRLQEIQTQIDSEILMTQITITNFA
jgi:hypothetical protein